MADDGAITGHFKDGFMWGTATASYQIEGARNEDGKSDSIWDTFSHTEGKIEDGKNGDVACDSYRNYEQDAKLLKDLGATHYRMSLSWSRLLPEGIASKPNQAGIDYYNKVINCLLANNVQPCVTLYHWDLPQCLHEKGGWADDSIIELFKNYARFCFQTFGDRVKMWITINEPHVQQGFGYGLGFHAPGIKDLGGLWYQVPRRMLLAHAHSYRVYDEEFRGTQKGQVSITLNSDWSEPKDPSNPEHVQFSTVYLDGTLGMYAHPIYVDGDYPPVLKMFMGEKLPTITEEEKKVIKGSFDFFGLNHYTTRIIEPLNESNMQYMMHPDVPFAAYGDDKNWERGGSEWLYIVPSGLRKLLAYIKKSYGNPPVIITENGCSAKFAPDASAEEVKQLDDDQRCRYIQSYVNEALKAVLHDGVDLRGYFCWSLMDNFEWAAGYTERFGLHYVDFEDPARKRTPRRSAGVYKNIIKNNGFPTGTSF